MTLPSPQQLTEELRSKCTCSQAQAADCHLRSSGVIIVDQLSRIVFADHEAIDVLRGPAEEWNANDDTPVSLRDNSYSGHLHDYWRFIERFTVSDNTTDGSDSEVSHHYLVVERTEDKVVSWMQVCVHYSPAEDGRELYVWSVRDISGPTRCLEMSRLTTADDYTLSLEDDGFPHTSLLTQAPTDCHPTQLRAREELARLLEIAAVSERFSVLHLTGFGAVDAVFPRRMLGWGETDLLDRSFIGLLSPDDRIFFCRALRRCHHDGIPQRLILKVASALAGGNAHLAEAHTYADCDVTVLMPEAVQQPVLVVRANDPAALKPLSLCMLRAGATVATATRRQVVRREKLDEAMPPTSAVDTLQANIASVSPHSSLPSPSLSATFTDDSLPEIASPTAAISHVVAGKGHDGVPEITEWPPGLARAGRRASICMAPRPTSETDTLSRTSTCTNASIDVAPQMTDPSKQQMTATTLSIHMSDIFTYSPSKPPTLTATSTLYEHNPNVVDGTVASIFERINIGAYHSPF
ncbi:hypothetical protein H4S04_002429 [Coemansia sp. S16]|nr:hypothetical protein H4S03_001035 [Coemansia sp. S3946]KAJ2050708.1 hypothetical protein H4S04_002429 [Coemansia sp. S16]